MRDHTREIAQLSLRVDDTWFLESVSAVTTKLHFGSLPFLLDRHTAIDRKRDAGGERGLGGGEVHKQRGDIVHGPEPPHRLSRDEVPARLHRIGKRVDSLLQRR